MSFSYSGDAPTDVHKIRLLTGDTREKDSAGATIYVLEDEEIDTLLGQVGSSIFAAAALAIRSRLAELARAATVRVGGSGLGATLSFDDAYQRLEKLAEHYESREAEAVVSEVDDWSDSDVEYLETLRNDVLLDRESAESAEFD